MNKKNVTIRKLRLPNGWTVNEYAHLTESVHTTTDATGSLAEFFAGVTEVAAVRTVELYHFVGATEEQQAASLSFAKNVTMGRCENYPWTHGDIGHKGGRLAARWIDIGDFVDEVSSFEKLRRGLHTDEAVDLEFQSIVQRMSEVNA